MVKQKGTKGRGRAKSGCSRVAEKIKQPGPGSHGTTISIASSSRSEVGQFYDAIPAAARILEENEVIWINNKGDKKQREVIGSRVLIRQQSAAPPLNPEILLLTDQMKKFQAPDKYIKCISMVGYALKDDTNDIKDSMIDVKFPYVMVFLGSMQLGLYEHKRVQKDVMDFVSTMAQVTPNTMVIFSGLVPRPMDLERSAPRCGTYTRTYQDIARQLRTNKGWNVTAVSVFDNFMDQQKQVIKPTENFEENIYLSVSGIRVLRAAWLRFLGYFPKKVSKNVSLVSDSEN